MPTLPSCVLASRCGYKPTLQNFLSFFNRTIIKRQIFSPTLSGSYSATFNFPGDSGGLTTIFPVYGRGEWI